MRDLVRETDLAAHHLVYPMFIELGLDRRTPIEAMPGIDRLSINHAVEEAGAAHAAGVPPVLRFGFPPPKANKAPEPWADKAAANLPFRALKKRNPDLLAIPDGSRSR